MIGRPAGDESRKVIIDLKTGRPNARHRQDLGFYALLETLARGVPPRKLATFYLDASEAQIGGRERAAAAVPPCAARSTASTRSSSWRPRAAPPSAVPERRAAGARSPTSCPDGRKYLDVESDDD